MNHLLSQVDAITKKYDFLNKNTGGNFNIFQVTGIATDEVVICRVLHELLSPSGSHGQGALYLKLFDESVLNLGMTDDELASAVVTREYRTTDDRWIDLVIQTSTKLIPIEVKIYAADQWRQCADYYLLAKNSNLFYLTIHGSIPSPVSAGGLKLIDEHYKGITCISFSEQILQWLQLCLSAPSTLKMAPIREIIQQLMATIRKFSNQWEDEPKMEIKKIVSSSPENMRNAIVLSKHIAEINEDKMRDLFQAIDAKMQEKYQLHRVKTQFDFENRIKGFYDKAGSTYPGIAYLYKNKVKEVEPGKFVDLWIRLEIDSKLFIGYCCPVQGEWTPNQPLSDDEIISHVKKEPKKSTWWAYWEYLPENVSPNFKQFNDAYFQLFDPVRFNELVAIYVDILVEFLELSNSGSIAPTVTSPNLSMCQQIDGMKD